MTRCVCGYLQRYHDQASQKCPLLQRGTFREPAPEPRTTWHGLTIPLIERGAKAAPVDRVPRREAQGLDEIAPAAMKLGMKARNADADVVPYFRSPPDASWWSILRIERDAFRAIAIWRRPAGGKWAFLSAAVNRAPAGAKRLGELLSELGEMGR